MKCSILGFVFISILFDWIVLKILKFCKIINESDLKEAKEALAKWFEKAASRHRMAIKRTKDKAKAANLKKKAKNKPKNGAIG